MAKRILAPIDARERSEAIVPVVAALARDAGSTVRLLRVFPVPVRVVGDHGRTVAFTDQEMARLTAEGLADLRRVEAEAFDADLIALGADRQGYLRTALAPGVADRVARKADVPTLTLRR